MTDLRESGKQIKKKVRKTKEEIQNQDKGFKVVIEELKQATSAKSKTLRRYRA